MTAFDVEPQTLWGSMGAAVLAGSLDAVVVMGSDGAVVEWNPAAERMFGRARADAIGRSLGDLIVPPELRDRHAAGLARHLETGATTILGRRLELEALRADGSRFPVELTVTVVPTLAGADPGDTPTLFAGQVRDLSTQRQLRSALSASQQHLGAVIDTAPIALISIDAAGVVRLARGRGVEHLGGRRSKVAGRHVSNSWAVDPEVQDNVDRALRGESFTCVERHGGRLFETTYHPNADPAGEVESVLAVAVDVTAREQDRSRVTYLVEHDALTGLANRARFELWATQRLAGAALDGTEVCLLLLDLDDFAAVNASRGSAVGDDILRAVAQAMAVALPERSRMARLGGDEFAALLPSPPSREDAGRIGHDVLRAIGEVASDDVCTASIGVVLAPPATTTDLALQRASAALTAARDAGGNTVRIHSAETSERDSPRTARSEVQRLIDGPGATRCVLQPLVDLATGEVVGYEALARFPENESRTVHEWFLTAHSCGLGPALEAEALRSAMARRPELHTGVYLSVNVSAAALTDPGVSASLSGDLTGVVVEITEHDQHLDPDALTAIDVLRSRGARIAVDDAGAGYSGLTRLAQLRPDLVKLDRLLVSGIDSHPEQAALVSALVGYAGSTGATICAEGIETAGELRVLADLDVQVGQGWLLGRPDPVPQRPPPAAVAACLDSYRRQLAPLQHPAAARAGTSLDALADVMSHIAQARSVAGLKETLPAVAGLLHAQRVSLSRLEAGDAAVREVASTGPTDDTTYYVADYPTTARVLRDGSIAEVRLGDPSADRAECAALAALGFGALLMLPLCRHDAAVGILEVFATPSRPWARSEIGHARILGQPLAEALQRLVPGGGSGTLAGAGSAGCHGPGSA